MSRFVEKYRSLLSFCSILAQICGWILLVLWAVLASSLISQLTTPDNNIKPLTAILSIFSELFPCLIILTIGQFIAYTMDKEGKLSVLLIYSNVILFFYAGFLALNLVLGQIRLFSLLWPLTTSTPWAKFFLLTLGSLLPELIKIFLLFAAGLLARQAIAAIKESKTSDQDTVTPQQ